MTTITSGPLSGTLRLSDLSLRRRPYLLAGGLSLLLLIATVIVQPATNWSGQIAAFAPLAIAAMASTSSVLGGGIDLSISPVMALTGILYAGYLFPAGLGGIEALPILVALGALVGLVNGFIVVKLRLSPLVATLAVMFIVTGVNLRLADRPFTVTGDTWLRVVSGPLGPIPGGLISIAIVVLLWYALMATAYRRSIYAVGGNDATAYSAGMRVAAIRILSYVFGSVLAVFAGLSLVGLTSSASATTSSSYLLVALAAVAIGGTSLLGGRGGVLGSILGAAALFLVQTLLSSLGVPGAALPLIYGIVLAAALVVGAAIALRRTKR